MDIRIMWIVLFFAACGSSGSMSNGSAKVALQKQIEEIVKDLDRGDLTKVDTSKARNLIESSVQFVEQFPKDSLSPIYLFRAADVSVGIGMHEQAIQLWGKFQEQYPAHERAPAALFFQGFTSDNQLSDKVRSANYYKNFLSKYPEHKLAKQAELLLDQLNLSPEELIRRFKKENGI